MKRIVWVLFSSVYALSTLGDGLTLKTLQNKLSNQKSTWTATENKVSSLPVEEQKRYLGAQLPSQEDHFFYPAGREPKANLKIQAQDWRNVNGTNYASPILDQGRCGSCVAFAAIGQLETQLNITRKSTDSPWAMSPQHLFSCGGGACEQGWTPNSALDFLETSGVPDEACFPYQSGALGSDLACSSSCSNSKSRSLRISGYQTESFFFSFPDLVKRALKKGPLMTTMTVYEDFPYYSGGVYKYTTGAALGGHAVVIEGWSESDNAWIVRNSWGEDWGEKGYFRIAIGDKSGVGNSAWSIEVPQESGSVSLGALRDRSVLSGTAQSLTLVSTFADTTRIRWQLSQGKTPKLSGQVVRTSTTTADTTAVPDGSYELVAIAERASGIEYSQPRQVFVLNGALSGSAEIQNFKNGDSVSGKQVLELKLQYSPIPFSKLVFKAKNLATGRVIERSTPHIATRLNLSFNTGKMENGDWELSLKGIAGNQSVDSTPITVTVKN